jgi:hypothetical protein
MHHPDDLGPAAVVRGGVQVGDAEVDGAVKAALGEHPKVVQERLGHSTISVTMDVYSHVLPDMQRKAADRLDALFADAEAGRASHRASNATSAQAVCNWGAQFWLRYGMFFGAKGRARTADRTIFSRELYQLSYLGVVSAR